MIGGSEGMFGQNASKECYEISNGQKINRASMFAARSNFGTAVYPNYSQIFIIGGSVSENEATKHCERYIVKDD